MINPAKSNWHETLRQVEESIDDCLTALGRYESAFSRVLHEHQAEPPVERPVPATLPAWDEKLAAAGREADEVEQLLVEQEVVWGRWRETFGHWQQMMSDLPLALATRPPATT